MELAFYLLNKIFFGTTMCQAPSSDLIQFLERPGKDLPLCLHVFITSTCTLVRKKHHRFLKTKVKQCNFEGGRTCELH